MNQLYKKLFFIMSTRWHVTHPKENLLYHKYFSWQNWYLPCYERNTISNSWRY